MEKLDVFGDTGTLENAGVTGLWEQVSPEYSPLDLWNDSLLLKRFYSMLLELMLSESEPDLMLELKTAKVVEYQLYNQELVDINPEDTTLLPQDRLAYCSEVWYLVQTQRRYLVIALRVFTWHHMVPEVGMPYFSLPDSVARLKYVSSVTKITELSHNEVNNWQFPDKIEFELGGISLLPKQFGGSWENPNKGRFLFNKFALSNSEFLEMFNFVVEQLNTPDTTLILFETLMRDRLIRQNSGDVFSGFSLILKLLHEGFSLDQIKQMSGRDSKFIEEVADYFQLDVVPPGEYRVKGFD